MAIAGQNQHEARSLRDNARALIARVWGLFPGGSDHSIARRGAATAFLIRVAGAGVAFLSQIVLARWMGRYEFGVYVYVWTWLLLIGSLVPLGLCTAAQRFIPEYTAKGDYERVRGYIFASRRLCVAIATFVAVVVIGGLFVFRRYLDNHYVVPLVLMCACLPMHALSAAQDGISRSYNWIDMALAPGYIVRPLVILAFMAGFHFAGFPNTALYAMASTVFAYWIVTVSQLLMMRSRLREKAHAGPRKYEIKFWLATAFPIFLVESFYFLLTYTDILVLEAFVEPDEVAVYYAATKILALVVFVHFAVSAATAHRFAEYHMAVAARGGQAAAELVRRRFCERLRADVRAGARPARARGGGAGGTAAEYGWRAENLRDDLCARFHREPVAMLHPDPALQALWRGNRDLGGDDVRICDAVPGHEA